MLDVPITSDYISSSTAPTAVLRRDVMLIPSVFLAALLLPLAFISSCSCFHGYVWLAADRISAANYSTHVCGRVHTALPSSSSSYYCDFLVLL